MNYILKNTPVIHALILIMCCTSCALTRSNRKPPPFEYDHTNAQKATVINYTVDGCSWLLVLEDGTKLQPDNMVTEFEQNNLKVWVEYKLKKNANSTCMTGKMITVLSIALREGND